MCGELLSLFGSVSWRTCAKVSHSPPQKEVLQINHEHGEVLGDLLLFPGKKPQTAVEQWEDKRSSEVTLTKSIVCFHQHSAALLST